MFLEEGAVDGAGFVGAAEEGEGVGAVEAGLDGREGIGGVVEDFEEFLAAAGGGEGVEPFDEEVGAGEGFVGGDEAGGEGGFLGGEEPLEAGGAGVEGFVAEAGEDGGGDEGACGGVAADAGVVGDEEHGGGGLGVAVEAGDPEVEFVGGDEGVLEGGGEGEGAEFVFFAGELAEVREDFGGIFGGVFVDEEEAGEGGAGFAGGVEREGGAEGFLGVVGVAADH
jgi:hypothetical protein